MDTSRAVFFPRLDCIDFRMPLELAHEVLGDGREAGAEGLMGVWTPAPAAVVTGSMWTNSGSSLPQPCVTWPTSGPGVRNSAARASF